MPAKQTNNLSSNLSLVFWAWWVIKVGSILEMKNLTSIQVLRVCVERVSLCSFELSLVLKLLGRAIVLGLRGCPQQATLGQPLFR